MTRNKVYLLLQAVVCIVLTAMLCASAVSIYREGSIRRAEHPTEAIYTPEIVAERLAPVAPLFYASIGLTLVGLLLGVRDDDTWKPARGAGIGRDPADRAAFALGRGVRPVRKGLLQATLIVAAVALIVAGALNGSARDVLYKAINLCAECVGLG